MPLSEYFKGKGKKVMDSMTKEYGKDKGKEVFYATANKKHMTSPSKTPDFKKSKKDKK